MENLLETMCELCNQKHDLFYFIPLLGHLVQFVLGEGHLCALTLMNTCSLFCQKEEKPSGGLTRTHITETC